MNFFLLILNLEHGVITSFLEGVLLGDLGLSSVLLFKDFAEMDDVLGVIALLGSMRSVMKILEVYSFLMCVK